MKKEISRLFMTAIVPVTMFSMQVHAESGDGFRLDEQGTVTIVSEHAAREGVSSLQFSLSVNSADAAKVEFQFEGNNARIADYRYDQDQQRLNVYLAGVDALFAENTDSLRVGRLVVLDGNGGKASAAVSVVEDSLQYVYGTELKKMEGLDLPGTVQMGEGGQTTPTPTQEPLETPPPTQEPLETPPPTQEPLETPPPTQEPLVTPPPTQEPQPEEPEPTQEPGPVWTPAPTQNPGSIDDDNPEGEDDDSQGGIAVAVKPGTNQSSRRPGTGTKPAGTTPPRVEVVSLSSPKPKESEPEQTKEPPLESEEDVEVSVLIPPEETPEPEQKKEEKEKGSNWLFLAGGAAVVLLGGVAAGSVAVLSRKPKAPRGSGRRGAGKRR